MAVIVGFDLSSKKVAASIRLENVRKPLFMTAELGKRWEISNAWEAYEFTADLIDKFLGESAVYVFIEEPVVARGNARTTIKQAYIHGAVHAALAGWMAVDIQLVPITSWKMEVLGKGNAGKQAAMDFAIKDLHKIIQEQHQLSGVLLDQDMADAYCVMLYGEKIVERAKLIGQT